MVVKEKPDMGNVTVNTDPAELEKFDRLAANWWDPDGEFRPLHDLNPARLSFIEQWVSLAQAKIADIGCGAGLLSEAMAKAGAKVTAIDAAGEVLAVAKAHAQEAGVAVNYLHTTAEQLAQDKAGRFDAVSCLEMLEHVPDPESVVAACASLVKPQGHVFFSTINRTPKAFALGIVAAEYLLGLLARGTHEYRKLIRPSELVAWGRGAGLQLVDLKGVHYQPFERSASIGGNVSINYIACFKRI